MMRAQCRRHRRASQFSHRAAMSLEAARGVASGRSGHRAIKYFDTWFSAGSEYSVEFVCVDPSRLCETLSAIGGVVESSFGIETTQQVDAGKSFSLKLGQIELK